LTIVKSVKITTFYNEMLTICKKKLEEGQPHGMPLPIKGNEWMCTIDEKRWSLYRLSGRKWNNRYRICKVRNLFNVKCLKQCLGV